MPSVSRSPSRSRSRERSRSRRRSRSGGRYMRDRSRLGDGSRRDRARSRNRSRRSRRGCFRSSDYRDHPSYPVPTSEYVRQELEGSSGDNSRSMRGRSNSRDHISLPAPQLVPVINYARQARGVLGQVRG